MANQSSEPPRDPSQSAIRGPEQKHSGYWEEKPLRIQARDQFYRMVGPSLRYFAGALPALFFWLIIPLLLLTIGIPLNLWSQNLENQGRDQQEATIRFVGSPDVELTLHILHPQLLTRHSPPTPGHPLAFWVEPMGSQPSLTLTTTGIVSPTLPASPAGAENQETQPAPEPTQTPTATPTPLVVAISAPAGGINLSDSSGKPIAPLLVLTPAAYGATPEVVYVRPVKSSSGNRAELSFSLPAATAIPEKLEISVETQDQMTIRWLIAALLGPVTLAGGLVAAVAGFAFQQWQQLAKQEEELRKTIEKDFYDNLDKFFSQEPVNFGDAGYHYVQFRLTQPDLHSERIESLWTTRAPHQLQQLANWRISFLRAPGVWKPPAPEVAAPVIYWSKEKLDRHENWRDFISLHLRRTEEDLQKLQQSLRNNELSAAAREYVNICLQYSSDDRLPIEIQNLWKEAIKDKPHWFTLTALRINIERQREQEIYKLPDTLPLEDVKKAFDWSYETPDLDTEWRKFIALAYRRIGWFLERRKELPDLTLQAVLRPWPRFNLWTEYPLSDLVPLEQAIKEFGFNFNPFRAPLAEGDSSLLQQPKPASGRQPTPVESNSEVLPGDTLAAEPYLGWIKLPVYDHLLAPRVTIVLAHPGSGRTATALYLIRNNLPDKDRTPNPPTRRPYFPVYFPGPAQASLIDLSAAISRTVFHYLAFNPDTFLTLDPANRASIARLFAEFISPVEEIEAYLRQAGLAHSEIADRVLQDLKELMPRQRETLPKSEDDYLRLLRRAFPAGFNGILVAYDLQFDASDESMSEHVSSLLDLGVRLQSANVYVKYFFPHHLHRSVQTYRNRMEDLESVHLEWSDASLREFQEKRYTRNQALSPSERFNVAQFCNAGAQKPDPDERLRHAAQGSPRRLLTLGNRLLQRFAEKGSPLSAADLDELLPAPPGAVE